MVRRIGLQCASDTQFEPYTISGAIPPERTTNIRAVITLTPDNSVRLHFTYIDNSSSSSSRCFTQDRFHSRPGLVNSGHHIGQRMKLFITNHKHMEYCSFKKKSVGFILTNMRSNIKMHFLFTVQLIIFASHFMANIHGRYVGLFTFNGGNVTYRLTTHNTRAMDLHVL